MPQEATWIYPLWSVTYITTVPEEEAAGKLQELYDADVRSKGFVANYTKAMSLRPEVIAHGAVLRSQFFTTEQVEAIIRDYRDAGLPPAEVAMIAFAEKITLNAYQVTPDDIGELRKHGCSDADILDIVLAAAARSFFSKSLDALGAEPDPEDFEALDSKLRTVLSVGRPYRGPS